MDNYEITVSLIEDEEMALYHMGYYWGIHRWHQTSWINAGFGWAKTPQIAFEQAHNYYLKIINNN